LRGEDERAVQKILQDLSAKKEWRFLLAPPLQTWIAVYPEHHGQDDRVSRAIAKRWATDVLHVLVHDDDIFCYFYYRAGKLVDQYDSNPDYFRKASAAKKARLRGEPASFRELLAEKQLRRLEELLHPESHARPTFASEVLQSFAGLLELPNALTSYEYLMEDETEGIDGWERFIHVPDMTAEKNQLKQMEVAAVREMRELRESGVLLLEESAGDEWGGSMPAACADSREPGFLVCLTKSSAQERCPLQRYVPPWSRGPSPTGIEFESCAYLLRCENSRGNLLLAGEGGRTEVWDLDTRTRVATVPHTTHLRWVGLTPTDVLSLTIDKLTVTSLREGSQRTISLVPGSARNATVNPTGSWLVINLQTKLGVYDLDSGRFVKFVYLGQRLDHTTMIGAAIRKIIDALQHPDPEALQILIKGMAPGLEAAGDQKSMVESMQRQIEQLQQSFGTPDQHIQGSDHLAVAEFSPDGRWLFCGTDQGVRVLDWASISNSAEDNPSPIYATAPEPASVMDGREVGGKNDVYALAYDRVGNRLLYAGLAGTIGFVNLADGRCGTLLGISGAPAILSLHLSCDCTGLCCICKPGFAERSISKHKPALLQIWNYSALNERAGC